MEKHVEVRPKSAFLQPFFFVHKTVAKILNTFGKMSALELE